MKCPNCGKEITDDSLFCEYCGAKIEKATPVTNPQSAPKKDKKKLITTIILVLIFGIGAAGLIFKMVKRANRDITPKTEQVSRPNNNRSNAETGASRQQSAPRQQSSYDENYYGGYDTASYYGNYYEAEPVEEYVSRAEEAVRAIEAASSVEEIMAIEQEYPDLSIDDFTSEQQARIMKAAEKFGL